MQAHSLNPIQPRDQGLDKLKTLENSWPKTIYCHQKGVLLPCYQPIQYMTYHNVELNDRQISILRTALDTRLQRIEEMIKLFQEPGTKGGDWMEEQYCQESFDVEYLQQMLANLPTAYA
jgi:hypothetical protein